MTTLAITVLGRDRPGIIADTTERLAGLSMNLEDSSMTLLRGHFAMTLICTGEASQAAVEAQLETMIDETLTITVREVDQEADHPPVGEAYLITVHGADQLGIVAQLTAAVAEAGGNITDLSTRLAGGLYVLLAEAELPASAPETLRGRLGQIAEGLGVEVQLRAVERDDL